MARVRVGAIERVRGAWGRGQATRSMGAHRTLLSIMSLNALVAVSGFVKDLAIAALLGTSVTADAFTATYFIVDTVGNNVFGNAVNVAAAAQFGAAAEQLAAADYARVVTRAVRVVAGLSVVLGVLLYLVRDPFLSLYILHPGELASTSRMYLWLLPSLLFYPCYSVIAGGLQATGRFATSIGAPVLLNLLVVAAAVWGIHGGGAHGKAAWLLCGAITAGAALMCGAVVATWRRWQTRYRTRPDTIRKPATILDFSVKRLYTGLITIIFSYSLYLGFVQGVGFAERYAAARLPSGSLAALAYAYRVAQVPNWVFVSALGVFLLPRFASAVGMGRAREVERALGQAVETCVMLILPVAIVFFVLRMPLVHILFERGAFSHRSAGLTATFVGGYAIAIVAQGLSALLFRLTAATGRMRIPLCITGVACAVNAAFDVVLTPRLGPLTIGIGATIGSGLCVIGLLLYLHRQIGFLVWPRWRTLFRYTAANGAVLVLSVITWRLFRASGIEASLWMSFGSLCVSVGVMAIAYWLILTVLGSSKTNRVQKA